MRKPKVRTIYSNYDLWGYYHEGAEEILRESNEELTDERVLDLIYESDRNEWEMVSELLEEFFSGKKWVAYGYFERWDGHYYNSIVFESFKKLLNSLTQDCDYLGIYDENGHLYIKCSHHDGTNYFEVKQVNKFGVSYLERLENRNLDDGARGQCYIRIFNKYAVLPHYMHIAYDCPKIEYEKGV